MSARPPRLARWIIRLRVAPDEREFIAGDIDEEFAARVASDPSAARRWYWRQARMAVASAPFPRPARSRHRPSHRGRREGALADGWQDVRLAIRGLLANPTLTVVAVATLGLGIGLCAAVFAMVDGILLRPLPFADADRIVTLRHGYDDGRPGEWGSSFPQYLDYGALDTFETLAGWQGSDPGLTFDDGSPSVRVRATGITWNLLPMLGVEPQLGRRFRPEDDAEDAPERVVIISHRLWQQHFGGTADVLGRQLRLDDVLYSIIGVMPPEFTGAVGGNVLPAAATDVWWPYRNSPVAEGMHLRGLRNVVAVGKLAPNVSLEQARQSVAALAASLAEQYPDIDGGESATLVPAHHAVVGWVRPILWTLLAAGGLVLLIASINVSNLLLARSAARRGEFAVRTALGAGRARLIRHALTESLLLGIAGGALACVLTWLLIAFAWAMAPGVIPRLDTVSFGAGTLAFVAATSVAGGLLLGLAPALHATAGGAPAIARSGRGTDRGGSGLRQALAVTEVGLSVVLLLGAGLLVRSLDRVLQVDPGFDPDNVLTARLRLPMPFVDSENWPRAVSFFDQAVKRAGRVPGVTAAAAAYQLPTDGGWSNAFTFPDRPDAPPGQEPGANFRPVFPGYFELAGIELLRGRTITVDDHADAPRVVVINEAFVDRYFADGSDPLGQRLDYGNWWAGGPPQYEIVGVVADVRFGGRTQETPPATYFPHAQQPVRELSLLLKTGVPPMQVAGPLRDAIAELDPDLPVDAIAPLNELLAADEAVRRAVAGAGALLALASLLLAAIGIYGVMSVAVSQRTGEIGVRMALGARAADVGTLIMRRGVILIGGGVLIGIAGALAASQLIRGLLFEVDPSDPVTIGAVVGFLAVVGLLACWIPMLRATRVDPLISLRRG